MQFQLSIFYKPTCSQKNCHGRVPSIRVFSADRHYINNSRHLARKYINNSRHLARKYINNSRHLARKYINNSRHLARKYINNSRHLARKYARIYMSLDIICSEKRTVFRERSSRKTVSFDEQIMSKDKYPSIFSPQMEAIALIILQRL